MSGFDKFLIALGACWVFREKKPSRSMEQTISENPLLFCIATVFFLFLFKLAC